WVTRFGLIMAMAGNAVGLGNFLRFPGKAAPYGGAFMIPYFLALLLVGIPLMWVEWTIGRHGGGFGHGTTPGMFHRLWKHPISKYLGVFGVLIPAMVGVYYVYIESWSLGYAWLTATGQYWGRTSNDAMKDVFTTYLGIGGEGPVSFPLQAYTFFLITFVINITIFALGISKGIEVVAKYCMPTLVVLGVVLMVRVLTLPPMDGRTIGDGLAQIWSVRDWSVLLKPDIWLAASGQIFFTLSVGLGMIHTYASYLRKHEDVVLSGLTACATNELVEVVIGASIAIPAAVLFFGVAQAQQIAEGGTFSIGFFALPVIFQQMPGGQFFGTIWFLLLFLAGLTSSMAMFTPLLVFLEDELQLPRRKGVALVAVMVFAMMQPVILFMKHGLVDELDYWMGEACLVLFVAI
ncbi:MAG TPA: sodium-dependent transporter, partial [Candidatus Hydrogenedentes bacterium]|nr:sodium-dependent transporter [Candidatus Hydrogenedentota bacterium]